MADTYAEEALAVLRRKAQVEDEATAIRVRCGRCSEMSAGEWLDDSGRDWLAAVPRCDESVDDGGVAEPDPETWCESCLAWHDARPRWEALKRERTSIRKRLLYLARKLNEEASRRG